MTVADIADGAGVPRVKTVAITLRIPETYHREPIITRLVSEHGLTVNITAALLGENAGDGWFSMDLQGTEEQLRGALEYLQQMDLEIWDKTNEDRMSW